MKAQIYYDIETESWHLAYVYLNGFHELMPNIDNFLTHEGRDRFPLTAQVEIKSFNCDGKRYTFELADGEVLPEAPTLMDQIKSNIKKLKEAL